MIFFYNNNNIDALSKIYKQAQESRNADTRTVSLYNVHYLHQSLRQNTPQRCKLKTNLTMAESGNVHLRTSQCTFFLALCIFLSQLKF